MSVTKDYAMNIDTDSTDTLAYQRTTATKWTTKTNPIFVSFNKTGVAWRLTAYQTAYDEIDSSLRPFVYYVDIPTSLDTGDFDDSSTALTRSEALELLPTYNDSITYGKEAVSGYDSTTSFYSEHMGDSDNSRIYFSKLLLIAAFTYNSSFSAIESDNHCTANITWSLDNETFYSAKSSLYPIAPYFKMVFTANSGYRFDDSTVTLSGAFSGLYELYSSEVSEDKGTITNVYVLKAFNNPSYDNIVNNEYMQQYGFTFAAYPTATVHTNSFTVSSQLANCTGSGIPSTATENDTLEITLTANDNYYFSGAPYVLYYDSVGQQLQYAFTISDDTLTATVSFDCSVVMDGTEIIIKASATPETVYKDDYGSIYVYHVTVANLQDFAAKRFFQSADSSGNITSVDLGDYVAKLHRVYCDIGTEQSDTLKLGNYNTSIEVNTPYNDTIEIDCGTIDLTGSNDTATDFLGSIKIFIPFVGFESLDVEQCVNHVIGLHYKCNIITGDLVAFVCIDDIDTYVFDGKIARDIYYMTRNEDKAKGAISFESEFLYGFTPYILHTYFTDYNNSVSTSDSLRKVVNTLDGFFKMNEITPIVNENMTKEELELITEKLERGVYYVQS